MLLLPNFQRTFGPWHLARLCVCRPDFFDRVAKVWAFIISTKFFCYFSKIFSPLSEPEDLKNCCFFEAGCKVTTSYHFNQIFLSDFEDFFLLILTETFEELFAFFKSGRQRYEEYFYQQIFLFIFFHSLFTSLLSYLLAICKELIRFVTLFILSFSLLLPLFPGRLFQIGLQR